MVPAMIYLLGMSAQVVVGTSLLQILFVTAVDDHGPRHHHPRGRHRARRPAAARLGRSARNIGARFAQKVKPGAAAPDPRHRRARGRASAWRSSSAGGPRKSIRCRCCEAARLLLAAARCSRCWRSRAARRAARWCPTCRSATIEIRYSFTGAELLLFGAILYPGGRTPGAARRHRRGAEGAARADRAAREAEGRRHLDECRAASRFRSAPSFYAVASSRPLVAAGRRADRGDLRARPRQSPALARRRRLDRRACAASSAGWSTCAAAASSMPKIRAASRSARACSTAPASRIPARVPVGTYTAETFLIARRPGDRRRGARDQDREARLRSASSPMPPSAGRSPTASSRWRCRCCSAGRASAFFQRRYA